MTRANIAQRLDALERGHGMSGPRTHVLMMEGQRADGHPAGIRGVPPFVQAAQRGPDESWDAFLGRVCAQLPPLATVVLMPCKADTAAA